MGLTENNIYKEKVPAENGGWGKDARERLFPLPGRNRSGHVPLNFPFFSPFNSLSRIGKVDRQS